MRTRLARTTARTIAAATVAAACAVGTAGAAVAAPAAPVTDPAPSSCRPANQTGVVTPAPSSSGHVHYRVVLTAAPGTSPCLLQGSPTGVGFSLNGSPRAVEATSYGDQTTPVAFGPGAPVAFDIQVPSSPGPATANEVSFTLQAPEGEIPGVAGANGPLGVDGGTQIGPVEPA
jgi:hypothetical protein